MKQFFLLTFTLAFALHSKSQQLDFWQPIIKLTDSIESSPVADQGSTPDCWAFGTNSLFETDLLTKQQQIVNLSEMFYVRYAYIDKAKKFLATKGATYFEGGGQFHDIIRVVDRYGMVPEEVYKLRLYKNGYPDQSELDTAMQKIIRKFLKQNKRVLNSKDLKQVNDVLDKYLGKVPATFLYERKRYTPKKFAKEFLRFNNDYIEVVAFSDKPLYKKFVLKDKYNWANDSFYNVTISDFKMLVDTALSKGWTVGWEGDVTERKFSFYHGYALADSMPQNLDEKRLANYKDETTERDHMLHIIGAGYDELNTKWYYMKNSWGTANPFNGYLYMEENYLKYKTVILFVNKRGLPESLKRKLKIN